MADLITLDEYKQAKAITGQKDDERLSVLIPAVSQLVKTYCGNTFNDYVTADKTEYFNIKWDTDTIQTTEMPLISVTSLEERPAFTEAYEALVEDTDFCVDTTNDCITKVTGCFYKGSKSVKLVYRAGYAQIPSDLELVMYDLVHYYYKDEYKSQQSINAYTMSQPASDTIPASMGWPDHIRRLLDMYRQI